MSWTDVCALEDILPFGGVAALVGGQDVAIFRVGEAVYAIGNHDPASGVNVLARGIVGDLGGEVVVASPLYKQHFSLISGRCLEDPLLAVPVYLARVEDGRVWVRSAPCRPRGPRRQRLVVVGNGMAAMRTVEELLEHAPAAYDITVFGTEPEGCYNRVLLSPLLSGEKSLADIVTHPPDWYRERGIRLHSTDPVVRIERAARRVLTASGRRVAYDKLLLATGSRPVTLRVPGAGLAGVMNFRDLCDVDVMLQAARTQHRAVVIGGGLLGLEAANGLRMRGMQVTVAHLHASLMERQLDPLAAQLLREQLASRGIEFLLPAQAEEIVGVGHAAAVRFADGTLVAADLVVVAIGVTPNVDLARAAGLPCDRGIRVDDTLATHDPAIYAVGECVQHRGTTFGLLAPLLEQARVCAAFLAGRSCGGYRPPQLSTQLKVSGIDLFSAGDFHPRPGVESLVLRDAKRGVYKHLAIERDRLCGAVLYGDVRDGHWYLELMNQRRDIRAWRNELMFGAPPGTEPRAP